MYNAKSIYIKLSTTHDLIIFLTPGILLGQLAAVAAISCLNIWSSVFTGVAMWLCGITDCRHAAGSKMCSIPDCRTWPV